MQGNKELANKDERVCFLCKKPGHFKRDCPSRRSKNVGQGQ